MKFDKINCYLIGNFIYKCLNNLIPDTFNLRIM